MNVTELNREQLVELKQTLLTDRNNAKGVGTSYDELANADALVSDEVFSTAVKHPACFIELGGHRISIEDVAAKFGIDKTGIDEVALCRDIHGGVLKAMTSLYDMVYPGIDIEVKAGGPSDIVVRVERPKGEDLRTLLYGSSESYIAYTDRDLDSDGPGTDIIIASGDPGNEVIVKRENQYAHFDGLIVED